ncbi:MAG TPA: MerR family transcriptional regulator [Mycobacteriales bacterium]|nr:MerR family transcriptional regulator [Mycobacteriales bacterium]
MSELFEDASRPLYTVGQVADLLDVQQAFLRRLDRQDIVRPARSEGSQRRYSRDDIDSVIAVRGLIDEGLTLEGVRRVLALQAEVAGLKQELAELREQLAKVSPAS